MMNEIEWVVAQRCQSVLRVEISNNVGVIEKERLETQKYLMQIEMCLANLDAAAMTDDEKNS